jgi:hypothetical protein
MEDLVQLMDASKEVGKYRYILEEKLPLFKKDLIACRDARIIYLIPKSAKHKVQGLADKVFSFGMLSNSITGSFAEEWSVIRRHLCGLDDSSRRSRNHQFISAPVESMSANFIARTDFHRILDLCEKHGDAITVGFNGGVVALESIGLPALEVRTYKWDNTAGGIGKKNQKNWIPGAVFSDIIRKKNADPQGST